MTADIGLIGLAVMGQNLVMNFNDHGYKVAVFNRTTSKVDDFLKGAAKGSKVVGSHSLKEFFTCLKRPRKAMLMVKAGAPVDELIEECLPFLEKGDILIDGGNSFYLDTERRCTELKAKGIHFIGAGVSGGEEGARHGPSIMPGGDASGWPAIKSLFQSISAKADDGSPCCDWVGAGGAGHFVKMVHNGIEYGDMQLITEAYQLLKEIGSFKPEELEKIFADWNKGKLNSYLIEITSKIFTVKDRDGELLLDKILDVAGQKGTGKWTAVSALDTGIPVSLINEAVFARYLSSMKEERVQASLLYPSKKKNPLSKQLLLQEIESALYASKIVSYAQGFMLLKAESDTRKWDLNLGNIALMWRGGCIIRSRFLNDIKKAYDKNPQLLSLLLDPFFQKEMVATDAGWRKTVSLAALEGVPAPCFSSALSFFDGYRTKLLPANLLQALRDFFGAHTYERVDQPRGKFFHTEWESA